MSGSGAELMMSAAEATWGMLILATIIIIGNIIEKEQKTKSLKEVFAKNCVTLQFERNFLNL